MRGSDHPPQAPGARASAALATCCQAWATEQTRLWTRRPTASRLPAEPSRPNRATATRRRRPDSARAT